jgi:DNA-binding NtrC family response regulator
MVEGLRILIVEDDEILGMNLAAAVEDRHCAPTGPVATVADALARIATLDVGGAILDASLLDRDVTPVAMELIERAIPFVIHTGVGLPAELATVFPHVSVIMKPTDPDDVVVQLLSQVQALRAPRREVATADTDASDQRPNRPRRVELVATALLNQFGDKAIVLARRQAANAAGDVLESWLDIIEHLRKAERPEE